MTKTRGIRYRGTFFQAWIWRLWVRVPRGVRHFLPLKSLYPQRHRHVMSMCCHMLVSLIQWTGYSQLVYAWAQTNLPRSRYVAIRSWFHRDHSVYGLSQWETTLQCNVVSHWLRPYTQNGPRFQSRFESNIQRSVEIKSTNAIPKSNGMRFTHESTIQDWNQSFMFNEIRINLCAFTADGRISMDSQTCSCDSV